MKTIILILMILTLSLSSCGKRIYYVTINQTFDCGDNAFAKLDNTDREIMKVEIKVDAELEKRLDISPQADLGLNPF